MASALDTLCGQSFGARRYHMLGIHTQCAMFVLLVVSIILALVSTNTKMILIALHQDQEISEGAGLFARYMILSVIAYGQLQCLVKFLQTQNSLSHGTKFWSCSFNPHLIMLDIRFQIRAANLRSCTGKFHLLLD